MQSRLITKKDGSSYEDYSFLSPSHESTFLPDSDHIEYESGLKLFHVYECGEKLIKYHFNVVFGDSVLTFDIRNLWELAGVPAIDDWGIKMLLAKQNDKTPYIVFVGQTIEPYSHVLEELVEKYLRSN